MPERAARGCCRARQLEQQLARHAPRQHDVEADLDVAGLREGAGIHRLPVYVAVAAIEASRGPNVQASLPDEVGHGRQARRTDSETRGRGSLLPQAAAMLRGAPS